MDLPGLHLLAGGDADGGTVGVQCLQPAAEVNLNIVAVAATQAVETVGYGDSYICGSKNRCALRTGNVGVGAGVGSARAGDKVYSIFVFYNLYETVVFWESEIFA